MADGMTWRIEQIERPIAEVIYSREISDCEAVRPFVEPDLHELSISKIRWSDSHGAERWLERLTSNCPLECATRGWSAMQAQRPS